MGFSRDDLKAELGRRLFGAERALPTGALGRLRRTAGAALRAGRLALRGPAGPSDEVDVEALMSLVGRIGELKGITMKAAQILSYVDLELPEELRAALSVLQTHAQPMSFATVRRVVESELGSRAPALLREMETTPVGAASIGQVHRAKVDGRTVAVKVQYPDVARAVAADFGLARVAAGLASRTLGNSTPEAFAAEARARTLEECDYEHEAAMQLRFGELLRDHPTLVIPGVHRELSAARVLTTDFVDGRSFDAWLGASPPADERNRVGAALFEFYVGSTYRFGLFNGDPHPGNYLFLPDGRVAVLDHGCVRELGPATVRALKALPPALRADDEAAIGAVCTALGLRSPGRAGFAGTRTLLRGFYGPMLEDRVQPMRPEVVRSVQQLLASKRELLRITLPGELLFLLRIRFGLMSILARLGAEANWCRLEEAFAQG